MVLLIGVVVTKIMMVKVFRKNARRILESAQLHTKPMVSS